jgi:ElaB/YqjD/DUF883 family membrane-anchored ribosome-binding protein
MTTEPIKSLGAKIAARARGFADTGQAIVKDNPWKIVGVTAIVGLAIGYLLRRR